MWVGAGLTSVLFSIGKSLIGIYIGTSGVASGFGAASSLVIVVVWVYYSAQVFLIGAEMSWVYANRWGSLAPSQKEHNANHKNFDEKTGSIDHA